MSAGAKQEQRKDDRYKDYIPVAERIEEFYQDHPQGRINTHIVEHDAERGFILMRAEVYRNPDDAMPASTGHAYEIKGEGYVNKTSYIENCETGATGRALALLGYEVKRGIASREEMQKADRMGDELTVPAVKPAPVATYGGYSESGFWKAGGDAQRAVQAEEDLATQRCGLSRNDLRDWIEKRHNTRALWMLDAEPLREYVKYLKGLK